MTTHIQLSAYLMTIVRSKLPYFIKYNAHTSTVRTWISQWFLAKKIILFFKNNFTIINHCKFIHHKSHLKPFLSFLPCIICREYFRIIFNLLNCALYLIKYGIPKIELQWSVDYTKQKCTLCQCIKYDKAYIITMRKLHQSVNWP